MNPNPQVSIELSTSQWWAVVYALRGEDLGGHQPSLANHLVRAITKPYLPSEDLECYILEEVYTEANELMELEAL